MSQFTALKNSIAAIIKENGTGAITGTLLQSAIFSMIDNISNGWIYKGVAIPTTNPGNPDGNVFYIASTAGIYPNFGGLNINTNQLVIIKNTTEGWTFESIGVPSMQTLSDYALLSDLGNYALLSDLNDYAHEQQSGYGVVYGNVSGNIDLGVYNNVFMNQNMVYLDPDMTMIGSYSYADMYDDIWSEMGEKQPKVTMANNTLPSFYNGQFVASTLDLVSGSYNSSIRSKYNASNILSFDDEGVMLGSSYAHIAMDFESAAFKVNNNAGIDLSNDLLELRTPNIRFVDIPGNFYGGIRLNSDGFSLESNGVSIIELNPSNALYIGGANLNRNEDVVQTVSIQDAFGGSLLLNGDVSLTGQFASLNASQYMASIYGNDGVNVSSTGWVDLSVGERQYLEQLEDGTNWITMSGQKDVRVSTREYIGNQLKCPTIQMTLPSSISDYDLELFDVVSADYQNWGGGFVFGNIHNSTTVLSGGDLNLHSVLSGGIVTIDSQGDINMWAGYNLRVVGDVSADISSMDGGFVSVGTMMSGGTAQFGNQSLNTRMSGGDGDERWIEITPNGIVGHANDVVFEGMSGSPFLSYSMEGETLWIGDGQYATYIRGGNNGNAYHGIYIDGGGITFNVDYGRVLMNDYSNSPIIDSFPGDGVNVFSNFQTESQLRGSQISLAGHSVAIQTPNFETLFETNDAYNLHGYNYSMSIGNLSTAMLLNPAEHASTTGISYVYVADQNGILKKMSKANFKTWLNS